MLESDTLVNVYRNMLQTLKSTYVSLEDYHRLHEIVCWMEPSIQRPFNWLDEIEAIEEESEGSRIKYKINAPWLQSNVVKYCL